MDINNIVNSTRRRNARLLDDINNKILNREYYKFKYLPLEGALPGLYFQQQTEDAINDIGNVAYATEKVADEALQVAQQAYNIALAALETANNALAAAQTAQQTADTALNKANAAQAAADAAQASANAAQAAAQKAQQTADAAQQTANNAANAANTAIETAINALTVANAAQQTANQAVERLEFVEPIVEELRYYDNVTESVDLNTQTAFARTYLQSDSNTNAPESGKLWLDVDDDFDETYIRQKAIAQNSGKTYIRFGTIVPDSDPIEVSEWTAWVEYAIKTDLDSTTTDLTEKITTVANNLTTHEADFNNPHKVTAEQLGLTTVYQYKGSVATYADLPTTGQKVGDVWNIETADPDHGIKAGDNVAWDGAQWDILGGNHDLSGYAQLAANNVFSGVNTFDDATIINGVTQITSGSLRLEKDGVNTISFGSATFGNSKLFSDGTNLIYSAPENASHTYYINSQSVYSIQGTLETVSIRLGNQTFAQNSSNGISVKNIAAPTADTDAANKKYVDDAVAAGGGGDVTAAGNNTFTGTNSFQKPITVSSGAAAGSEGVINLGIKNASLTTQASISAGHGGDVSIRTSENQSLTVYNGTYIAAAMAATQTTARLDMIMNRILDFNTTSGLVIGGGGTNKLIAFYPEGDETKAGMRLSNANETIGTDYSILMLQNNPNITYANNISFQAGQFKFLEIDNTTQNLTLSVDGSKNATANILFESAGDRLAQIDYNGTLTLKEGLVVGSSANTNTSNGVIRAGNSENCLYFCGTAENTYYATPNTGNTISYQSSANCYLINCSINDPSSLNMNFSNMNFKATVGSVPYMCKTLTFWLPVGATVPAVTWTFPTGSTVYYPKGVAPTLTANANNIINVIAIVDDTDSFFIQVCETVVLPYSG